MPGANIALFSACEAMGIVPAIITSVGASEWGATDPDFTWLDLESILYANNVVSNQSIAASLGGRNDEYKEKKIAKIIYGGKRGAELASKAINRNSITKIKPIDCKSGNPELAIALILILIFVFIGLYYVLPWLISKPSKKRNKKSY